MPDTTWMVKAACDADRQPSYARHLMTLEECIDEYTEAIANVETRAHVGEA